MAATTFGADEYIAQYCIDTEDWTDADDDKKQRIVNVAFRTLSDQYPTYTIPDNAIYEFANVLAIAFNDTNKAAQYGVQSTSLSGVVSTTFRDGTAKELSQMIPQSALTLIGAGNGVTLSKRRVGWSVM